MNKKIIIIVISALLVIFLPTYILSKNDFFSQWGKVINQHSLDFKNSGQYKLATDGLLSDLTVAYDDIYEVGKNIIITKSEYDQMVSFYELQKDSNASENALKYIEEYNALYVDAIANGYDVTENEIDEYVLDLKKTLNEAENKDNIDNVISKFESEEAYWEYEKIVCMKQLPIQKYVASLEKEYDMKDSKLSDDEKATIWNDELDRIKEKLRKSQDFKEVTNPDMISKEFID